MNPTPHEVLLFGAKKPGISKVVSRDLVTVLFCLKYQMTAPWAPSLSFIMLLPGVSVDPFAFVELAQTKIVCESCT